MKTTPPSVLGEARIRAPISGRIRSGLKVLTKQAQASPEAKRIYEEGMRKGLSFEEIGHALEKAGFKGALVPKNTPFFVVRRRDFVVPETADRILELYGDDRGDGERRLYRFPVVFAMDHWLSVIPHGFRCFTASELKFWSEYAPDGRRVCMTHAAAPADPRSRRAKRAFGGRPVRLREENGGLCDPNACPEYQGRQCNLSGEFLFYIPGIPGAGMISLPTNSFYSMLHAREKLEMVAAMRGGRIAGLFRGRPLFEITKREREVSMLDPQTGQPRKTRQWLIELESTLDAVSLMRPGDPDEAAALLAGETPKAMPPMRDEPWPAQDSGAGGPALEAPKPEGAAEVSGAAGPTEDAPEGDAPGKTGRPEATDRETVEQIKNKRKLVHEMLRRAGIEVGAFRAYAERAWGAGWSVHLEALERACETLDPLVDDPEAAKRFAIEALGAVVIQEDGDGT